MTSQFSVSVIFFFISDTYIRPNLVKCNLTLTQITNANILANGILDGVDAALAYHVGSGRMPVGLFMYNSGKTMMYSVDGFRITVHGQGAHGALCSPLAERTFINTETGFRIKTCFTA